MPGSVETVGHVATTISMSHVELASKVAPTARLHGAVGTPDTLAAEVPVSHARQRHTNPAVLPSIAMKKGIDIERYKTQLCKTFRKTGQCPYFDRCMFAHGARELRTAEQNAELVAALDATKRPKGGRKLSSAPPQDVATAPPCTDAWVQRRMSGTSCRYLHDPSLKL